MRDENIRLFFFRVACWQLERNKSGLAPWITLSMSLIHILVKVRQLPLAFSLWGGDHVWLMLQGMFGCYGTRHWFYNTLWFRRWEAFNKDIGVYFLIRPQVYRVRFMSHNGTPVELIHFAYPTVLKSGCKQTKLSDRQNVLGKTTYRRFAFVKIFNCRKFSIILSLIWSMNTTFICPIQAKDTECSRESAYNWFESNQLWIV